MGNSLVTKNNVVNPIISAEDARSHISDEEYRRLRSAFQRFKNGSINYEEFCYHVLGGAQIPDDKRRLLFSFFSRGAETINFEQLLSSLVGLCRVEEVQTRFIEEYKEFSSWGLRPPMLTIPLNDSYISFYEVMSYVTHLSVKEVIELEKVFATISDRVVCKLTLEKWKQALGSCFPSRLTLGMFDVFDENRDGQIDFRELVCTLSALCRGPMPGRTAQLARLWDLDCDRMLSDSELEQMYEDLKVPSEDRTVVKSNGDKAALIDFGVWAQQNEKYVKEYYTMALEIGHICLGLRPENLTLELEIVDEFEKRTSKLLLNEWNIVASSWHNEFKSHLEMKKPPNPIDNTGIKGTREDSWTSKVACISAESARLRANLQPADFIRIPVPLWKALLRWHGCAHSVDSQFTRKYLPAEFFEDKTPNLELYPFEILLMGHDKKKNLNHDGTESASRSLSSWACAQVSRSMTVDELLSLCKSELRLGDGDARLWQVVKDSEEGNVLLDDGNQNLHQLYISLGRTKKINRMKLLLEVREPGTGVWPEELRASISGKQITAASTLSSINAQLSGRPGAVGLVNYGNFCYRNAAIQCLSRVSPLTQYFLNENNVHAIRKSDLRNRDAMETTVEYANLLREMWEAKKKNIAPNDFNDAIRMNSDLFESNEQHDCQEFVAFLLDQLHTSMAETKQRIKEKKSESGALIAIKKEEDEKYETETDEAKAEKSWNDYVNQNDSLVTTLFTGQLKSRLVCRSCNESSSVFEAFNSLSLPIGFEDVDLYQVIVVRRDGRIPRRYGFRLSRDSKIGNLRDVVAQASGIDKSKITVQCMSSKGMLMRKDSKDKTNSVRDDIPLRVFPSGARLYALELPDSSNSEEEWRVAMHRKLQYNHEPHILGSTAGFVVSRFGLPLILSIDENVSGKTLYDDVMFQMARFMEASVNSSSSRAHDPCEDDASGYPFTLCLVDENYEWCGQCPALRFCRGCPIRPEDNKTFIPPNCPIAVDWLPIALYLRYNHSQEQACEDDVSVADTWSRHFAPSSLEHCLEKFSCPETLDAAIDCERCQKKTTRDKIMTIWKLPKYLIIHLKRFEFLREQGRMGKCKRTVNFPLKHFDPTPFVDKPDGLTYECIALANHYGQLSSGHFIAYAKSNEDKWLMLNDCSVREVSEEEVDKQGAYLLFYERKETN